VGSLGYQQQVPGLLQLLLLETCCGQQVPQLLAHCLLCRCLAD
jgi:hypothetical protein